MKILLQIFVFSNEGSLRVVFLILAWKIKVRMRHQKTLPMFDSSVLFSTTFIVKVKLILQNTNSIPLSKISNLVNRSNGLIFMGPTQCLVEISFRSRKSRILLFFYFIKGPCRTPEEI